MKNILYTSGANLKNIIPQLSCRNKFYPILFFISGLLLSMSALQAQVAPTLIPTGGFEIDGGLKSNTPTVGAGDWILGTGGSFVLNNAGTPVDPVTTGHVLDAYNSTADLTFTASKFNQDPNTWSWSASKASSKDDINNVMYHVANDASNYTWLIVGADRLSTNGTSYIDFEFLQKTLTRNSSGGFTSAGLDGGRTVNDIVLSMEYDNGGSAATFHMYFWKPSGSGYTYVEQTIPAGVAFGMTNSNNEDVPFGAFGNSTYIPYQFVEGAINLTAFFGYVDPCFGISVKSLVVKTKASTATTASLGDFVEPIQVNFNFGTAAISYATILCQIGTADVTFSGVPGGSYSSSPAGLSINSSTGQINLASSTPGSYTITYSFITNGCAKSVTTNVIVDPLPVAPTSASVDRNTVCEQDNGNITLSATGGSGTTLQWFNGSCGGALIGTGNSISIPSPTSTTTYYVHWENSCGNSSCAQVTVIVSSLLTVSATGSAQVSCNNGSDGSITVTATGGTGSYNYSLNGGTAQSSNVFSGLSSGTYTVTVNDTYSCSAVTNSIVIANPPLLTASAVGSAQVSCFNSTDGVITVTAAGGTGAYSYSLNGGAAQSSNVFSGLASGSYNVVVTDAKGCSASLESPIVIANPALLTASANGSAQVSCFNSTDGMITVTAAGGTGAYSYSLNGGATQSSNVFYGLAAGSYVITVLDANSCTAITSSIVIADPALLTASASGFAQVSCNNASDGMITVTAAGGTGAYSYSLNGGAAQSSNVFSGLASGSYNVVVTDAKGCSASLESPIVIANPALLTASATGSAQVSCNNASDGMITVTAVGGTGTYSYSLNGGAAQSSNVFSDLASGSYNVVVTDAKGCAAYLESPIVITNPALLTASATGSAQVSCFNSTDGVITVTAVGGTGTYSYSLNGGAAQSSNVFSDLASGSYNVVVTDAKGCSASLESPIVIANPPLLTASAVGSAQVSCFNSTDGVITVTAAGGTGAYSYSLNGGAAQSSNVFSGLASGSYNVVVTDAKGCSASLESPIVIANPALLTASATGSAQVSCNNASDGVITVTAVGGTGAYSYSLNGGAAQSSNVFSGLASGSYVVTVLDANGCPASLPEITIVNPAAITFTVAQQATSCSGIALGIVTISAQGGTPPYEYSINGGADFSATNTFDSLKTGVIYIIIKDANNCTTQVLPYTVNEYSPIVATVEIVSGNVCYGSNDAEVQINATGGSSPYNYSLDQNSPSLTNIMSGLSAGDHTVNVYDSNGCKSEVPFTIASQKPINISLLNASDANCVGKKDGMIQIAVEGGIEPYSYSWSNGEGSPLISGLDAGTYTVTVTDNNGCPNEFTREVNAGNLQEQLDISNAFSPNGDGINDLWVIKNLDLYPDNTLTVVNRWGNEVLSVNSYQNNWDGSQLLEGTYFYVLKCKMCDTERTFKGYITIVR